MPVVLAIKVDPTVNNAELTDVDILANPVPIIAEEFATKLLPTVNAALLTDVAILALPVVNIEVLLIEEFTVLLPTDNKTDVNLTFEPTLAPVLKLPVPVEISDEFT